MLQVPEQLNIFALSLAQRDRRQITQGLNLTLELKSPLMMLPLLVAIEALQRRTDEALKELHFVHFARFLPTRDNQYLLVITEFDGDLEPYVMDFAASISEVFSAILAFVKDAPPLPVHEHPDEFWAFIQKNNKVLGTFNQWALYSSYPDKTVLDIIGPRKDLPPPYADAKPHAIRRADVQGNILKGYRAKFARHFALRIRDARQARLFLAATLGGDDTLVPQVSNSVDWGSNRPSYFLNIGMTASGLDALEVPEDDLALFPAAFLDGPANSDRAKRNGDIDDSAPSKWILGAPGSHEHLFVSLYADDAGVLDARTSQLRNVWDTGGIDELFVQDAADMGGQVHFGYKDGISQPRIAGISGGTPDMQPDVDVGEFLLGSEFRNIYGNASLGKVPESLGQNGSFAAIRILEQDVDGFEQMLATEAGKHGIDKEEVAAKLVGRWRNGDPLPLAPDMSGPNWPNASIPDDQANNFDYAPTPANPGVRDDYHGNVCPVGAHMRRMNPRGAMVAGKPYSRRIIRRGMPYTVSRDGAPAEKGLMGVFICASLERQFEFLMNTWANGDIAASGIRDTQDPILGAQTKSSQFIAPVEGGAPRVFDLKRLVRTRGSLYVFIPGLSALRRLAGVSAEDQREHQREGELLSARFSLLLGAVAPQPAGNVDPHGFDPDSFNPKDPAFLNDPYPFYAQFRKVAPVHYIPRHDAYWVFSHELVTKVCNATDVFLKQPVATKNERGLFFMDPPRHTAMRPMMDALFAKAIASASANAATEADLALKDMVAGGTQADIVSSFAKRVPRNVFMTLFGVPAAKALDVDHWADTMLHYYDRTLPPWQRARFLAAAVKLQLYLSTLMSGCPAGAPGLMCLMTNDGTAQGMTHGEVKLTGRDFALGGYLSTQFLIATGLYNLLRDGAAPMQALRADMTLLPNAIAEMLRFDAPFQMADRFAAADTVLGGVPIPKDARVVVVYGSANRDKKVFSNPDVFDITRTPSAQSYGLGHGIHTCIGRPLVEIVMPIALKEIVTRLPKLRLASDTPPHWLTDPYFRSFDSLQMTID